VGVETAPLVIAVRAKSPLKTAQERLEYSSTLEKHQIRRNWPSATMYAPPNGKRHRNQFHHPGQINPYASAALGPSSDDRHTLARQGYQGKEFGSEIVNNKRKSI
jgi:hypothetical protein